MAQLESRVVLVAGGTKGIGLAIVTAAARAGARVVFTGRDVAAGEHSAAEVGNALGATVHFYRADAGDPDSSRLAVEEALHLYGRIDGVVNNAAVFPRASLVDVEPEQIDAVLNVNLRAPMLICRHALRSMMQQKSGVIVNIGSTHAWAGSIDLPAYAVSKGGLHTLTQHIAKNYASYGIRANWVTVGWVETPGEVDRVEREGKSSEWLREQGRERVPLGRLQTVDDIANSVIFLLSDLACQVTGTDIHVTGGFLP